MAQTLTRKARENNYAVTGSLHVVSPVSTADSERYNSLLSVADREALENEQRDVRVWDPSVDTAARYVKYATSASNDKSESISVHARRQALDRRLRRRFKALLSNHGLAPPIQAYERWLFNARASATAKQRKDPLLPFNIHVEPGLVSDLLRAGIAEKDAKNVVRMLGKEATACVQELLDLKAKESFSDGEDVVITMHQYSVDVSCGKYAFCKLSLAHFEKLQILYARYSGKNLENEDGDNSHFSRALMALLLRYQSMLGHGFQAAMSNVSFNVLNREFGVDFECFASPLNSRWGRHCSAFTDTDGVFGSLGDFFSFKPHEGSFEVNPPFVRPIMEKAAEHVEYLLARAEAAKKALSFVVVLPAWEECTSWTLLKESKWLQAMTVLPGGDHGFIDGAQHQRQDRYRPSPYPTAIYFLQTRLAETRWPVTEKKIALLRYAMILSMPTKAEADRRMRAGRGFGDLDGGGGVYKGKKKSKRGHEEVGQDDKELDRKRVHAADIHDDAEEAY
ncbi:mRNA (2'-O-methyladenosine-N(6)-)-methyltransferase [Chytriomyces hyalinus]|nr:mRNA (2'-O-methyladenosine-N(6)-)-methyltransferase [Chytriomyces hyalinus]